MSGNTRSGDLIPVVELRLPAEPASVRAARRHLRGLLVSAHREQWADSAELALSEIATNAVLHAHTDLLLRVHVRDAEVEVEVEDGNPALPAQRRGHDAEATTGRGLELVSALTRDCGVRSGPAGKVVWFTVADDQPAEPSEEELLAGWDAADADWNSGVGPAPQLTGEDLQPVVLLALPTTLWLAAREHHHAILRELVLYLAEHGAAMDSPPDIALADEARHLVWTRLMDEVDRARAEGIARSPLPPGHPSALPEVPESVDLHLQLPRRMAAGFAAFQDALDTAERLSVAGQLLVRPALPEIIAVRDWLCDQVVAQLQAVPAAPWPGTDQSRFTELVHDREDPALPEWDSSQVTASDRGVVAADDANRIIAISDSLARTLGWDREDIVGRRVVALIPPALREAHVAGFSRHLTTGQASVLGIELELPVLRKDGSEVPCRFLVERAEVGSGRPVYLAWIEPLDA
jgi:PAS domain S-box-containing protein